MQFLRDIAPSGFVVLRNWNAETPRTDHTFLLNTRPATTNGGHTATVPTIPLNNAAFAFYRGKKSLLWKPVLIPLSLQVFCERMEGIKYIQFNITDGNRNYFELNTITRYIFIF
jgi:hypothetical protein